MRIRTLILIVVAVAIVGALIVAGSFVVTPTKAKDFNSDEQGAVPIANQNTTTDPTHPARDPKLPIAYAKFGSFDVKYWVNLTNGLVTPVADRVAWPSMEVHNYSGTSPTYYWGQSAPKPLTVINNVTAWAVITMVISGNFQSTKYLYTVMLPGQSTPQQGSIFKVQWTTNSTHVSLAYPTGVTSSGIQTTTFNPGTVYFWEEGSYNILIQGKIFVQWRGDSAGGSTSGWGGSTYTQSTVLDWGNQNFWVSV